MTMKAETKRKYRCFACDKFVGENAATVDTHEDQYVFVGSECYKLVLAAGKLGYQPPRGGPRLYALTKERRLYFLRRFNVLL